MGKLEQRLTWEYPAHLYLKKVKADQAFGTAGAHRAALAGLVDLTVGETR